MPKIDASETCQTVITTFECSPGTCGDLLDALEAAYAEFLETAGVYRGGIACERRAMPDRQLLAMGAAGGFSGDAADRGNAATKPGDCGALHPV